MLLGGGLLAYEGTLNLSTALGRELDNATSPSMVEGPIMTPITPPRSPSSIFPPSSPKEGNKCP
jgi:hypothetical protein